MCPDFEILTSRLQGYSYVRRWVVRFSDIFPVLITSFIWQVVLELNPSPLDPPIEVIAQLSPNLLPTSLTAPDHSDEPKSYVALRQGRHFLTTFHPELTNDGRFHEYFIQECVVTGPRWFLLVRVLQVLVPTCKSYESLEDDRATYLVILVTAFSDPSPELWFITWLFSSYRCLTTFKLFNSSNRNYNLAWTWTFECLNLNFSFVYMCTLQ